MNERKPLGPPIEFSEEDEPVTYHYSREKRLAKASPRVRELYEEGMNKRFFGSSRPGQASRFFVLIPIILVLVFIAIGSGLSKNNRSAVVLKDNTIGVTAYGFPEVTYLGIKKTARSDKAYTGPVDVAVSIPVKEQGSEAPIETTRVFFTLEQEENFRITLPFEARELIIVLQAEDKIITLRVKSE
jgi:hypothetical protein